jgi:hypothetical protein
MCRYTSDDAGVFNVDMKTVASDLAIAQGTLSGISFPARSISILVSRTNGEVSALARGSRSNVAVPSPGNGRTSAPAIFNVRGELAYTKPAAGIGLRLRKDGTISKELLRIETH